MDGAGGCGDKLQAGPGRPLKGTVRCNAPGTPEAGHAFRPGACLEAILAAAACILLVAWAVRKMVGARS